MKPSFESVSIGTGQSFLVREFKEKRFSAPYHHHPEYELTLILQGRGIRYTGGNMQNYDRGDMVLLGPDLPHCWKTDTKARGMSISIVVHFRRDFLGENFFEKPEMKSIAALLNHSSSGLHFQGGVDVWQQHFARLVSEPEPFRKMILLMELLQLMSVNKRYRVISRHYNNKNLSAPDTQRINKITSYIVANFQKKVSLDKAASSVNMTPNAFCRYFKKITRKTFIEAVNDYRIDYAMNKLIHSEISIAEIGYDSGYNDLSNFNRMFRQRHKASPLQYRNKFQKEIRN